DGQNPKQSQFGQRQLWSSTWSIVSYATVCRIQTVRSKLCSSPAVTPISRTSYGLGITSMYCPDHPVVPSHLAGTIWRENFGCCLHSGQFFPQRLALFSFVRTRLSLARRFL